MSTFHMVVFRFKPDVCAASEQEILQEFLTLPQKCRDSSQDLYIKSLRGGVECSTDSPSEYSHVFLVEFGSVEEREYYKAEDPVHADSAARIIPMLDFIKMSVFQESSFE